MHRERELVYVLESLSVRVSSVCSYIQAVEVGSPGGGVGGEKLYTALCQNGGIVVMELTSLLAGAHEPPEGRSAYSWAPATGTWDTHNFAHNLPASSLNRDWSPNRFSSLEAMLWINFVIVYKVQCHNDMYICACCFLASLILHYFLPLVPSAQ